LDLYLIYTGNYHSLTGGYIYNRKVVEQLQASGVSVKLILFPEFPAYSQDSLYKSAENILASIPQDSKILVDSLVYGKYTELWRKYQHNFRLIPLVHLPLFANPNDEQGLTGLKETEMEAYSFANQIIVTSDYTKSILERSGTTNKLTVIKPGIDDIGKKTEYPSLPFQLLCVSNVIQNKNQLMLIKTLKNLKDFNWTLNLVGSLSIDKDYVNKIQMFINENGMSNRILIYGSTWGDNLKKLYSKADLFIFPSKFETYGMAVAEAIECGLPVLAFESEGVKRSFKEYPVHYFNSELSLKNQLTKVFEDQDYYRKMIDEILDSKPAFPRWKQVADKFMETLQIQPSSVKV
jgi:glycosyltransferase involved in cell wall biosynthesis